MGTSIASQPVMTSTGPWDTLPFISVHAGHFTDTEISRQFDYSNTACYSTFILFGTYSTRTTNA